MPQNYSTLILKQFIFQRELLAAWWDRIEYCKTSPWILSISIAEASALSPAFGFPLVFLYMKVLMGILHVLNPYNPGHLGNDATNCMIYLEIHTLHFTNTLFIMYNLNASHFVKTYVSKVSPVKYDTDYCIHSFLWPFPYHINNA